MDDVLLPFFARRSLREFTTEEIPLPEIELLVTAAGRAPSSKNTQPWQLHLVRGESLERLREAYLAAFDRGEAPRPDYRYSPDPLPELWAGRAKACGIGILQHKKITREDREGRRLHDRANFGFFNAPQVFFLTTLNTGAQPGVFMDCGFVLNNLMLGLTARGWGSCPQFSAVAYPDILRQHLPEAQSSLFIAGLACGRPLPGSHINEFQPARAPLSEWFHTHN